MLPHCYFRVAAASLATALLCSNAFANTSAPQTWLILGNDLAPAASERLQALIAGVDPNVQILDPHELPPSNASGLVISLGDSALTNSVIAAQDLYALGPEGFIVRTRSVNNLRILAADGNAATDEVAGASIHRGASYGAYAALEELGFAFLHPLNPIIPKALSLADHAIVHAEKPQWPERGLHLHTMHPIELSHVLNGWGPDGPCGSGDQIECDDSTWDPLEKTQWESYLEWMTANRQNMTEWVLLQGKKPLDIYADSATLARRLAKLVARAHAWDMRAGVDIPIALEQQNGWRMVRTSLNSGKSAAKPNGQEYTQNEIEADYQNQIQSHLDFIMSAKFDFIGTEMGFSEFTSPSGQLMLSWINTAAEHLRTKYPGVRLAVKSHVSTGQFAEDRDEKGNLLYPDWQTGKPIDFNYLTAFADSDVIVLPHTVEAYSLTDPAPTYGNQSFADMHRFLTHESFSRDSIWYPETAYWVSVDSDVPLFLPIYPERRIADLRMLAEEQKTGQIGPHLLGQLIFSSGWEWGYWLNDVIAARAAWNPHLEAASDTEAFQKALTEALRVFGPEANSLATQIANLSSVQSNELIAGKLSTDHSAVPASVDPRATGFAYLSGVDTWDEISFLLNDATSRVTTTQPRRIPLGGFKITDEEIYRTSVRPLLADMATAHEKALSGIDALSSGISEEAEREFKDLRDSLQMTALRASQIADLYTYAYTLLWKDPSVLKRAQGTLDQALALAKERKAAMSAGFPDALAPVAEEITSWGRNPTVYPFGYIWTAQSLYYWWRDEGVVTKNPGTPCYLNVLNPADVALAAGTQDSAYQILQEPAVKLVLGNVDRCIAPAIQSERDFEHAVAR